MELITNLWASFFSSRQEKKGKDTAPSSQETKAVKNEIPDVKTERFSQDILSLEAHFGAITNGRIIETDLHTLLTICPRERRKSDSYKGLSSELKKSYGVELRIIPKNIRHED